MKNKKPSVAKPKESEDITIIILEDPLWDPAFEDLRKRGDPTAIARLLRDQVPMPAYICRDLGIMLDPPQGYKGVRLYSSGSAGVREREKAIKKLLTLKQQAERVRALQGDGKVEAAVADVQQKLGIPRSTFFELKKFGVVDVVLESQKILGYADSGEGKTKKKQIKRRTRRSGVRKKES